MKSIFIISILLLTTFGQCYCQQNSILDSAAIKRNLDSIRFVEYRRESDSLLTIFDSINNSLRNVESSELSSRKNKLLLKQIGWTNDFEHIFSNEQIIILDSIIEKFEKETTIEIAIITIDSSFILKNNFDDAVVLIGNIWGVGKKGKNNGIVIGISKTLRKIRISNGYGIEAKLTDNETKKVIDDIIIPEFKQGNFYEGIRKALIALIEKLR